MPGAGGHPVFCLFGIAVKRRIFRCNMDVRRQQILAVREGQAFQAFTGRQLASELDEVARLRAAVIVNGTQHAAVRDRLQAARRTVDADNGRQVGNAGIGVGVQRAKRHIVIVRNDGFNPAAELSIHSSILVLACTRCQLAMLEASFSVRIPACVSVRTLVSVRIMES